MHAVKKDKKTAGDTQLSRPTGGSITFSISCLAQDKKLIKIRAKALGMTSSAYLIALARQEAVRPPESDFVMVSQARLNNTVLALAGKKEEEGE